MGLWGIVGRQGQGTNWLVGMFTKSGAAVLGVCVPVAIQVHPTHWQEVKGVRLFGSSHRAVTHGTTQAGQIIVAK